MSLAPENLPRHELIGLEVEVVGSPDEGQVGISGEVLDETKDLLRIEDKEVEKADRVFLFKLPSGEKVELEGNVIHERPEERAGMKLPSKWD